MIYDIIHLEVRTVIKRNLENKSEWQNKRAKRAQGRSPDEKVKGHSGAIYRGSLMLSTKYW